MQCVIPPPQELICSLGSFFSRLIYWPLLETIIGKWPAAILLACFSVGSVGISAFLVSVISLQNVTDVCACGLVVCIGY